MPVRNIWIASIAALFLSLGVVGGTLMLRWEKIVEVLKPAVEEERFDPITKIYWDRYFTHLYDLQKELQDERAHLEEWDADLTETRDQLERRARELDERARKLQEARDSIRQWFVSYSESERANYQRVAKTYAAMEAEKVVPILLATDSKEVAKVLLEMKPETVAPIWTALLEASNQTEANANRVSRLIELMSRVHQELEDPPDVPAPAAGPAAVQAASASLPGSPERFTEQEIASFQRIAKTYEAMDPEDVAPILLASSARDAAGVLLQMRPENVAEIWSAIIDASRQREGATEKVVAMAEVMRRNRNGV